MIQDNHLVRSIDYYSGYQRPFSLKNFMEWSEVRTASSKYCECLKNDPRFVQLAESCLDDETIFISELVLFRWWFSLNARMSLPHINKTVLTEPELFGHLNLLAGTRGSEGSHKKTIEYGEKFGFVTYNSLSSSYVFPLTHLFSYIRRRSDLIIDALYDEMNSVEKRDALLQESLSNLLKILSPREGEIVRLRFGMELNGSPRTLEEIGKKFNLTRERIRQIEKSAVSRIPANLFVKAFLAKFIRKSGRLLIETTPGNTPYMEFASLLLGIPYKLLPGKQVLFLGLQETIEPKQFLPYITNDPISLLKAIQDKFAFLPMEDLNNLEQIIRHQILEKAQNNERIYIALKQIGQPAHYGDIADTHNELFPEKEMSYKNVHATLSFCSDPKVKKHGIVWVGMKGTYALKEWGYSKPEMDLFETVNIVVNRLYKETGKPVSYNSILAEIGNYRKIVNPNSVAMVTTTSQKLRKVAK